MNYYTFVIKAGGAGNFTLPGKVLSVKTVTGPLVTVAFDGKTHQPIFSGTVLQGPFHGLGFLNAGTNDVTVGFFVGDTAALFAPADNSGTNAKSYAKGNLGIANGTLAAGGNPQSLVDANGVGWLQITNGMQLTVPGTDKGNRRQIIFISVAANSLAPLLVCDQNTGGGGVYPVLVVPAGNSVQILTDSTFVVSGAGNTAAVIVSEIYLAAS